MPIRGIGDDAVMNEIVELMICVLIVVVDKDQLSKLLVPSAVSYVIDSDRQQLSITLPLQLTYSSSSTCIGQSI